MRRSLLSILLLTPLFVQTASGEEPAADSGDSDVVQAVAELSTPDIADNGIELTSGTSGRDAHWRPGLLGHRYVEARYLHFKVEHDGFIELLDDSSQGIDATLNLPIPGVLKRTGFLGMDTFLSHRYLLLSGKQYFPPPDDIQIAIERDSNVTQAAASFYVDHAYLGPVRPFMQLGLQYVALNGQMTIDGNEFKNDDDGLTVLIAPGVEVDLCDSAALRATFDLVNVIEGESSTFFGDLIIWPWDRVFLRAGIKAPFNGAGTGGIIGTGVEF